MAAWIPHDPNEYLDAIHTTPPPDWETAYAGWRYSYAPGLKKLSRQIEPGINCTTLLKNLKPFVPLAIKLVPEDLTSACDTHQEDWKTLPSQQIRDVWNNRNMLFAKIVLTAITLEIWRLAKTGAAGKHVNLKTDEGSMVAALASLRALPDSASNVVKKLKVQLATSQFSAFDSDFWETEVVNKPDVAADFKAATLQHNTAFLKTFAKGNLVTIRTLRDIKAWHSTKSFERPLGVIAHKNGDDKRIAAEREIAHEASPEEIASRA